MKVGDLVRPSSKVQFVSNPFRPSEWNKVFLIVEGPVKTIPGTVFFIWRNNRKFPIIADWLEVVSESR